MLIDADREKQKRGLQKAYQAAAMTAILVNSAFMGGKIPSMQELYPDIFPPTEQDMTALAKQFAAYAQRWNASREREEK